MNPLEQFINDQCGNGCVADYGKDEDDDNIIVFHSWGDMNDFAEALGNTLGGITTVRGERDTQVHWHIESFEGILAMCARCDISVDLEWEIESSQEEGGYDIAVDRIFDWFGYEQAFSDTHERCSECSKIICTQPTSYFDAGRFIQTEEGLMCRECVEKQKDWYLEDYLEKLRNGEPANFILSASDFGFVHITETKSWGEEVQKWQNGFHAGMDDDPAKQLEILQFLFGPRAKAIFEVSPSQFYVEWTVAVPEDDLPGAKAVLSYEVPVYRLGDRFRMLWYQDLEVKKGYILLTDMDDPEDGGAGYWVPWDLLDELTTVPQILENVLNSTAFEDMTDLRDTLMVPDWVRYDYKTKCDLEPAEGLRQALEDARGQMRPPGREGIQVVKLDATTGTAVSKVVSQQDFIDGKSCS